MPGELIVEELVERLQILRQQLLAKALSTQAASRAQVEELFAQTYKLFGSDKPEFVWHENPLDLSNNTLQGASSGDQLMIAGLEETIAKRVRTRVEDLLGESQFNTFFHEAWKVFPRDLTSLIQFNQMEIRSRQQELGLRPRNDLGRWADRTSHLAQSVPNSLRKTYRASPTSGFQESASGPEIEWSAWSLLRLATAKFAASYWDIEFDEMKSLDLLWSLAESAHAYLCLEGVCHVCNPPDLLALDAVGRFHSESGPAIRYGSSYEIYAWHGTRVPASALSQPVTIEQIDYEPNVAIRRVLIERYGISEYVLDSGCQIVDRDDYGVLYRKEMYFDEPIVLVRVTNSTPEPDGEYRSYFLRVPPDTRTVRDAVAWTFGITADEYHPTIES